MTAAEEDEGADEDDEVKEGGDSELDNGKSDDDERGEVGEVAVDEVATPLPLLLVAAEVEEEAVVKAMEETAETEDEDAATTGAWVEDVDMGVVSAYEQPVEPAKHICGAVALMICRTT